MQVYPCSSNIRVATKEIVSVLDLVRIERGQSPFTALELRED